MQQSPSSSNYMYPSSPMPLYDSGYTSFDYSSPSPTPFHFSSCPYSNESFYMPLQPCEYSIAVKDNPLRLMFYLDPSYYCPTPYSMPEHSPSQQPFISSTPVQPSNVYSLPSTKVRINFMRHSYLEEEYCVSIYWNPSARVFPEHDSIAIFSSLGVTTKTSSSTTPTSIYDLISNSLSRKSFILPNDLSHISLQFRIVNASPMKPSIVSTHFTR